VTHGGARQGAGRKKGGHNRIAEEAIERARGGGELPLDFLLRIMRDDAADEAKRIDCAKAAAPYLHPKLQPVDDQGDSAQKHKLSGTGPGILACPEES
jgi:hypothetical protein